MGSEIFHTELVFRLPKQDLHVHTYIYECASMHTTGRLSGHYTQPNEAIPAAGEHSVGVFPLLPPQQGFRFGCGVCRSHDGTRDQKVLSQGFTPLRARRNAGLLL